MQWQNYNSKPYFIRHHTRFYLVVNSVSYICKFYKKSSFLDPVMLADDTNIFYSNENINNLSKTANEGLNEIHEWFGENKPSINEGKTIYFYKQQDKDRIPPKLPTVTRNVKLKRVNSIRLLGVIIDEHIN